MTDNEKRVLDSILADPSVEVPKLLEAIRTAYWHLDTYGIVRGDEREQESQDNVFNLCRPYCPMIPGRL